ncbi:MAG: NAD-dependent epimerase/dehydratase family protein [Acidimicrobiia bacterium]
MVDGARTTGRYPRGPGTPPAPPRRVLVLGAGLVGAAVAHALAARGAPTAALTRSAPDPGAAALLAGVPVSVGDATDGPTLAAALDGVGHVVHAFGSASPATSEADAVADEAVVAGLATLLGLVRDRPGTGLTLVSSGGAVYGEADVQPVPETAPARPIGAYGATKRACEDQLARARHDHGLDARVVRVANVYGARQRLGRDQGLVAHLLRAAREGTEVPLYGGSEPVRDFVHVDDVAAALAELVVRTRVPPVLNVGTGRGHAIGTVVRCVEGVTGRPVAVRAVPARPFDVRTNVLDVGLLRRTIPYAPRTLEAGVAATWAALTGGRQDAGDHQAARRSA